MCDWNTFSCAKYFPFFLSFRLDHYVERIKDLSRGDILGISCTGPRIQNIYSHWNITSHSHVDELFVVFHEYETMSLSFFQSLSLLFQVQQVA